MRKNKTTLETEKARDQLHDQIEEIEQWLHQKRTNTDDDEHHQHHRIITRHDHVCEGEDLDPSRVDQISWYQTVHVLNRPLGQKTSSQSHHQQGFGTATNV